MAELLDTDFLPSSEDDRKRVRDAVIEACGLKQIVKDKNEQIKDVVDYLHSEFEIPKKIGRQMINTHFKDNYIDVSRTNTVFEVVYETLFKVEDDT
jgi:hypothetical protein